MKTFNKILILVMLWSVAGLVIQCQHDDSEIIPVKGPDPIERGTETVSCVDCTPVNFDASVVPAGTWYFDKSHSNVTWETKYRALGSLLTGRFNTFFIKHLTFSEVDPTALAFEGQVYLNTVNTGEPGRDGSCLLTTYGTAAGKTNEVENLATLTSIPGTGKYSTTDAGYYVDANLTFHGFTKKVLVKLFYYPQSDQGTYLLAGLSAQFEFLSKSDFGISSSNVDDMATVKINANLRNKK